MTADLARRFAAAKPGECVIYHVGDLATDRLASRAVEGRAAWAWGLAVAGAADLVQRRTASGCEYVAVKRAVIDPRPVAQFFGTDLRPIRRTRRAPMELAA